MKLIQPLKIQFKIQSVLRIVLLSILALINSALATNAQAIAPGASGQFEKQPLAEIKQAAKNFLEEKQSSADNPNVTIKIGNIDPRIRLKKCDAGITAFFPQGSRPSGKTTVGVRCKGPVAWKLFIPATIEVFQDVWVASRSVSTNEILTRNDLKLQKVQVNNMRKLPIIELSLIENTSPKRPLRAGSVIFQDSICMVCRGEKVSVSAQNQFISVVVEGVALNDAILGETAQIRNAKSKRVFGAIVTGKNQLNINLSGTL